MTVTLDPLAYYAAHGAALFPLPAGYKEDPGWKDGTGIIRHFSKDWSRDPEQWAAWRAAHPACNFGLVAAPSKLIIADIDVSEVGRDVAWTAWSNWWRSRGLEVPQPHIQSARGGWHVLFQLDDTSRLRQVPLIGAVEGVSKKAIVDIRLGNGYAVAAGSYYDGTAKGEQSGHYSLLGDVSPHPAPAALIEACGRANRQNVTVRIGFADPNDTARVLEWMAENDYFASYHAWIEIGMILRGEFGDDPGLSLWQLTNDGTASADEELKHWNSFSSELTPDDVKMNTLRKRAKDAGCPFGIGVSAKKMFEGVTLPGTASAVAQIAADAGALLPLPPGASLAGNTSKVIADLGQPILDNFFETTKEVPIHPRSMNYPQLPTACAENYPAIFDQMNTAIQRIVAMAETPQSFRQQRVLRVLALLSHMHPATHQALVDRINGLGCVVTPSKAASENKLFENAIVYEIQGKGRSSFIADSKGRPDSQISDNVGIFLSLSGHRARFDEFPRKVEIADDDAEFALFDQDELDRLWTMAKSSDYNFHPAKDMFRSVLKIESKKESYDSLRDHVDNLAYKWDGTPRLDTWLHVVCGVDDDTYHRVVGINLIGGLVRRARYPGCKHDETVIFISADQGMGKSTLCRILALNDDWFLGSFKFGGTEQNTLPKLAGKWVIELGELAGLNKTDVEDVKTFLTETEDEYVAKYEAEPTKRKRRCLFIGTSNNDQPLSDISGNRRFLPVHIPRELDLDWLRANVEQLLAEAAVRDEKGESFAIPRDAWELTKAIQEASRGMSSVEECIRDWFERPQGSFYITSADLTNAFRMAGFGANIRPAVYLRKIGWRPAQVGSERVRAWIRHPNNDIAECLQMVPTQAQANGRVEMRLRPGVAVALAACPVPPPPMPSR